MPTIGPEEVQGIVDAVAEVQPFWAQLPLRRPRALHAPRGAGDHRRPRRPDRAAVARAGQAAQRGLHRWSCCRRSTASTGSPTTARGCSRTRRSRYPQLFWKQKKSWFAYEPLGVVGVIAPWNYPWSIPFGEVAIALMCGNGVVLKPASLTPLIGQRIQDVFERAGLPDGTRAHRARRRRGRQRAGRVERRQDLLHRLGRGRPPRRRRVRRAAQGLRARARRQGPDDRARATRTSSTRSPAALWGGFANAGQTCSGIERVYVVRERRRAVHAGVVDGAARAAARRPGRLGHRGRPDGVRGAVRDRARAGGRRGRERRDAATAAARSTCRA